MERLPQLSDDSKHTDFTMSQLACILNDLAGKIINKGVETLPEDDPVYGKQWTQVVNMMNEKVEAARMEQSIDQN